MACFQLLVNMISRSPQKMVIIAVQTMRCRCNQGLSFSCYTQVSLSKKDTKRKVTGSKGWANCDWGFVGRTQRSAGNEKGAVGQVCTALGTSESE